jgi:putative tryptophan/tyrosine transport system substrate-binding protein
MDRRRFLLTSLASALGAPLAAGAQQVGKVYTIGVLSTLAAPSRTYGPVFSSALRDSGYELGRNLVIESRYAAGKVEQLPDLAADLVRRKVDVILAFGASESQAAVKTTATIPIVFTSASPVELGLVRSLARPGGNATGLSVDVTPEIAGKLLELLKTAVPSLSRIVGLVHSDRPELPAYEQALKRAAQILRVEARLVGVRHEGDFEAVFAMIAGDRPDALMLAAGPLIFLHRKRVTDFAAAHVLPTVAGVRDFVDDGGLMSYGPNFGDLLRQVVHYIDRILKGAKPADLPVEQPSRFEFIINLKTAKALGLTIPPSLLARADEVIE